MEEMTTNPGYTQLTCPRCGSLKLEFVTEYHKCILARIFATLLLIGTCISAWTVLLNHLLNTDDGGISTFFIIISITAYFLIQCYIFFTESKTHVQGVCRNCGNIWLLN